MQHSTQALFRLTLTVRDDTPQTIILLPTGSGKTFIAALLLQARSAAHVCGHAGHLHRQCAT